MLREKILVVLLTITVLVVSNLWLGGYLFSYRALGSEIAAPPQALHEWHLNQRAPFEYRLLFPTLVNGVWWATNRTNSAFYWSYVTVSLLCGIGAALAFFHLLLSLGLSTRLSLFGIAVFLLLPPFLLAYTLPVHTREDTLAYLLLCTGLLCLIRKKYKFFVIISILGVCCRETLLILPFVLLFYTYDFPFLKRVLLACFPIVVWILIRVLTDTVRETYNPFDGLAWNLNNPAQVVGFTFITFGPLWVGWAKGRTTTLQSSAAGGIALLARSSPGVLLLILVSTFLGGIYNEIRLLYIGFPWVIALFLFWVSAYLRQLKVIVRTGGYLWYAGAVGIGSVLIYYLASTNSVSLVGPVYHDVPVQIWLAVFSIMVFITLATLPLYWMVSGKILPSARYD